jgi:sugar phosphate isomerase/epimerase
MKLGLLTAAFPDRSLEQVADWAAANGYQALEIACWPAGEGAARRYAGVAHIDVDRLDADGVRELLAGRGLELSALAYYPNPLDPDDDAREQAHAHLRKVILAAEALGVEVVGTFAGRDKARTVKDNFARFAELFPPLVEFAGEHGVKIAIENCPMLFSDDEWPGGTNLAYSPANWREMFALVDRDNFGLNLDPSHLVWQFIDYERAVYEFGPRIFHVHGKDLEVRPDGLYDHGVMALGVGWQVPRMPGLGQVDWGRFVAALYAVGYDHVISVEHEDRTFEGDFERVVRGFEIARNTLAPLLA